MSDFKWEMQQRVDAGMSPDAAYNATRDSYAAAYDNRDKFAERHPEEVEYAKREKINDEFHCDPDESGGVRDDDDAPSS